MKEYRTEIGIAGLLMLLIGALINPWWMPMGIHYVLLIAFIVVFGSFVLFLWREQGGDERDMFLRGKSDRLAFLVGASVLAVAIAFESFAYHTTNKWIVSAFAIMLIAKAVAHIYTSKKH